MLRIFGRPFDGTFPNPHFGVALNVAGRYILIDPYGWHSPVGDPWELDSRHHFDKALRLTTR